MQVELNTDSFPTKVIPSVPAFINEAIQVPRIGSYFLHKSLPAILRPLAQHLSSDFSFVGEKKNCLKQSVMTAA